MDCKHIKDLLYEFIDNELSHSVHEEVEEHLNSCPSCREQEQSIRASVIEPFRHTEELRAPEGIWERIEEKIGREKKTFSLWEKIPDWLKNFKIPSPVYAGAGLVIAVLAFTLFLREPEKPDDTVNTYIQEQLQFFSRLENKEGVSETGIETEVSQTTEQSLQQEKGDYLRLDDVNLGTTIEKYFL